MRVEDGVQAFNIAGINKDGEKVMVILVCDKGTDMTTCYSNNCDELKGLNDKIEFKNVSFEYFPNHPISKNLNIIALKNETLAIIGAKPQPATR